jgi:hypothetical protein
MRRPGILAAASTATSFGDKSDNSVFPGKEKSAKESTWRLN